MRLTRKHIDILLALADAPTWAKARELRKQVGHWPPTFYNRMHRLIRAGLVTQKIEQATPQGPTWCYRLTREGGDALRKATLATAIDGRLMH
jgi:DNA-binding MarR family transcriptional regulator